MAYSVMQGAKEIIGVRMALGAIIGITASMLVARLLRSMLYGVTSNDAFTMAAVTASLVAVALVAIYVPARRATRVDPLIALCCE